MILLEIYEGWKNLIFENPQVEEEAKRRIKFCVECKELNSKKFCEICGCYTPAKARNLKSHCPLIKW